MRSPVFLLLHNSFLTNPVEASINAFLIDTGDKQILIDTGAGKLFGQLGGGKLQMSLKTAGYEPSEIDTVLITHIHTDHSGGLVESQGESIEFWGDILHFGSVQFPQPEITVKYDVDSPAAAAQRAKQFANAERSRQLVAAAHLPFPGIGHIRAEGEGYAWIPIDYRWRE